MRSLPLLFALFSMGSSFILVPDDLLPLLNAFYSRFPPIRIGMNNTKVGLGFRMGRNVDFQFLVELGPQDAPRPTDSSKREVLAAPNPVTTVQNRWPSVQNPVTTVQSWWPVAQNLLKTVQNPVTTNKSPSALPVDFISRLRRRRPMITAPTTNRTPITMEVLSTELDVKENEIDSGNI